MGNISDLLDEIYEKNPELKFEVEKDIQKIKEKMENEKKQTGELFKLTNEELDSHFKTSTDKQLLMYLYNLNEYACYIKSEYHRKMKVNVFDVSKVTLKELINQTSWSEVAEKLVEYYHMDILNLEIHQKAYESLQSITPIKNKDKMVIDIQDSNVIGIKPEDYSHYAIEFQPWKEWLGYFVNDSNIKKIGIKGCIAYILWEMTFVGYSDEEVQEQASSLENTVQQAKSELNKNK